MHKTNHIRPTREADVALLPAIERSAAQAFRKVPGLAWIAADDVMPADAHLDAVRRAASWVAVDEADRPLGFLVADRFGSGLHIDELSVRLDAQGRGFGGLLVGHAQDEARRHGLRAVTLTTFRGVAWNERFYRRLGFRTLDVSELDERLKRVLGDEAARGLPAERRCAMRWIAPPPLADS